MIVCRREGRRTAAEYAWDQRIEVLEAFLLSLAERPTALQAARAAELR